MRMRKKPNLTPRMEACAALWVKEPEQYKGNWRSLKPDAERLRLELGCGKGRFTAETAAQNPQDLYVAVEKVPDAMVIAMERCRELGLTNVFFIDGDAACLDEYFAPDEVDLIYINFCDPWPSVRHAKRRLTHEDFLRGYRRVLKDGGEIQFKSDNRDLYEWSLFQFPKAGYELSQVTRDLHANGICGVMTDYEAKFHALGTPINRCVGTKLPMVERSIPEALGELLPGFDLCPLEDSLPAMEQLTAAREGLSGRGEPEKMYAFSLWKDGAPAAVLECAEGWPRARTVWIARLLVAAGEQREETGRAVIDGLTAAAEQAGFAALRLACDTEDADARAFWDGMGFHDVRQTAGADHPERAVAVMERRIYR